MNNLIPDVRFLWRQGSDKWQMCFNSALLSISRWSKTQYTNMNEQFGTKMFLKIEILPVSSLIKIDITLYGNPLKMWFFPTFSVISSFSEAEILTLLFFFFFFSLCEYSVSFPVRRLKMQTKTIKKKKTTRVIVSRTGGGREQLGITRVVLVFFF